MFPRIHPVIFYETPDVTATAAQGTQPAQAQPTQGQGQQQAGGTGDFWHLYPGVPEEHRPLLEPTMRDQVMPYITRLEQQLAPFRSFEGIQPQDAAGLLQMAQDFEKDPVDVWLKMGHALFEQGEHLQDVDMEFLRDLATGNVQEEPQEQNGGGQLPPELAQHLQPIAQQLQGLTQWQQQQMQAEQERQRQQMESRQNQAYTTAVNTVRQQVEASGFPKDLLTDKAIRAAIIAEDGIIQNVVSHFVNTRSGLLKGFVDTKQPTGQKPNMPNGNPPAPKQRTQRGGSPDRAGFDEARTGAEQFLRQQNSANAQG